MTDELWEAMRRHHPNAIRLGSVCYVRLDGGNLAKAECIASSGYYDGLRLTILNPSTGPVDTLTIRRWDLPRNTAEKDPGDEQTAAWEVHRPALDIAALAEMAAEYLRLFYVSASKPIRT